MDKHKNVCIVMCIFLLAALPLAVAQTSAEVLLTLKDITTNQNLDGVVASFTINDQKINLFLDKENNALHIPSGQVHIEVRVYNVTPHQGMLYYGSEKITVHDGQVRSLYVYPVGSLHGTVTDRQRNLVSNAHLKIECSSALYDELPDQTDEFGSFSVEYLSEGMCNVFASHDGGVGQEQVMVKRNTLSTVEIALNNTLLPAKRASTYGVEYILALATLVVLIALLFVASLRGVRRWQKRTALHTTTPEEHDMRKHHDSSTPNAIGSASLAERALDIIKTLSEREQELVAFIQHEGGTTTQARIHHRTGIPKASCSRNLKNLETKQIIKVTKMGSARRIHFTKWFLGKDDTTSP